MTGSDVSQVSARGLLTRVLRQLLADEFPQTRLRLFHCDSDEEDRFVRFAGLLHARWALFDDHERVEPLSPTLGVGLMPLPDPDAADGMPWLGALFGWPGFAYLPYGFTKEELLVAARNVVEGAKMPLPPGLLPTPGDVLRVTSEVRHWLDNRRQNVERTLDDFARVARGEIRLHRSHLEPVAAISDAHRRMLDRLWALEPAALRFAPSMGGLAPMKVAVGEIEICWLELESQRAALRSDDFGSNAERLAKMVVALEAVSNAIENAIAASRALDVEIHAKMVMR